MEEEKVDLVIVPLQLKFTEGKTKSLLLLVKGST